MVGERRLPPWMRWTVVLPRDATPPRRRVREYAEGPTPRYARTPQWGLVDEPRPPGEVGADAGAVAAGAAAAADVLHRLLGVVAVVYAVSAGAHLVRFGLALYNQRYLLDRRVEVFSRVVLQVAGVAAVLLAVTAWGLGLWWLVRARRAAFAAVGAREPRPSWQLVGGCLVPGVNLVLPGVFLRELVEVTPWADGALRARRLLSVWWTLWAGGGALVVVEVLWRQRDGLVAQVYGLPVTAAVAAFAAGVAGVSALLVRAIATRTGPRRRPPRRLIPAEREGPEETS